MRTMRLFISGVQKEFAAARAALAAYLRGDSLLRRFFARGTSFRGIHFQLVVRKK